MPSQPKPVRRTDFTRRRRISSPTGDFTRRRRISLPKARGDKKITGTVCRPNLNLSEGQISYGAAIFHRPQGDFTRRRRISLPKARGDKKITGTVCRPYHNLPERQISPPAGRFHMALPYFTCAQRRFHPRKAWPKRAPLAVQGEPKFCSQSVTSAYFSV